MTLTLMGGIRRDSADAMRGRSLRTELEISGGKDH